MNEFTLSLIEKAPFAWQLLMFLVTGIAFELLCEWLKAVIKQALKKDTLPSWIGLVMGVVSTICYTLCAVGAYKAYGYDGWYIPGYPQFIWVWAILFFFWQYVAIKVAKPIFKKFFPAVNDPNYVKPEKEKKEKKKETDISKEALQEMLKELLAENESSNTTTNA